MASKQDPVSGVGLLTNEGGRIQPYSPGPSHATQTPGHRHCFSVFWEACFTRGLQNLCNFSQTTFLSWACHCLKRRWYPPQRGLSSALTLTTAFQKSLLCLSRARGWLWNVCLSSLPCRPNVPLLREFFGAMQSLSPSYFLVHTQALQY